LIDDAGRFGAIALKRTTVDLLLPVLLLVSSCGAKATELVMGVEDLPYLPYYSVEQGESGRAYGGYARELFDAFAAARGHSIRYRPLPVERLYRELLHGVMVPPEHRTKEKDGPLKIGTVRGFTPWPLMPDIDRGTIQLSENNSISGLLRQCIEGRLDGVYLNVEVARFQLKNLLRRSTALVLDDSLPHSRSAYYVSTIRRPGILAELDVWLREHREQVGELRRKWGIEEGASPGGGDETRPAPP
jgi:polar amino acid transport system substrate-binding protein